jgi:arylsulfatase A-like enzyme
VVLIVLDGAQPEYFSTPAIPHVRALIRNGVEYTNAFAGILESETPSGHAAIDTGSQPRQNGILSFDWANSDNLPVTIFNEQTVRAGRLEQFMKRAPAPSLASVVHAQDPKAKVVALSGYKYYAADALGGPDADAIMYFTDRKDGSFGPTAVPGHVPPAGVLNAPNLVLPNRQYPLGKGNQLAMQLAARSFQTMHQKVTLINLPEFDWPLGHVNGAGLDQSGVRTLMQGFDRDLASLEETYRRAGVLNQTLFVLTADHGFAPTFHHVSHTIMNDAVAKAGTKIIRDTYHTAGYAWLQDESKAGAVASILSHEQNPSIQAVYFRSIGANGPTYLRATGDDLFRAPGMENANQYLLNTFNGPNGPDVVVLMKEDSSLVAGTESTWKGDHGGAAWKSQHLPLIMSGPGVRQGYVSDYPAPLMDIAPTALTLLNAPVTGMQGVALADALQRPSILQRTNQQTQGAVLRPVVSALQAESRAEVAAGQ